MEAQKTYQAAYQGIAGAYSQEAIFRYFDDKVSTKGCEHFDEVVRLVEDDIAEYGFMPAENSIAGTIVQTYDLLLESTLNIIGEFYLPIHHNLMVLQEVDLKNVKKVYSHPQALAQCEQTIKQLGLRAEAAWDTAGSAKRLREETLREAAAIAGHQAAEVYDLKIVASNIEDLYHNTTRFFILSKKDPKPSRQHKTSILMTTKNAPGALVAGLRELAERNINLSKIESRPDRRQPWHYIFYLDFDGHIDDPPVKEAMIQLLKKSEMVKILGSYPSGTLDGSE